MGARIQGLDQLRERLERLPEVARAGAEASLLAAAETIVTDAQALVPVRTGNLRDSLALEVIEANDEQIIIAVGSTQPAGDPGTYSERVEFGDEDQTAQPFMRPATDSNAPAIEKASAAIIRGHIEQRSAD